MGIKEKGEDYPVVSGDGDLTLLRKLDIHDDEIISYYVEHDGEMSLGRGFATNGDDLSEDEEKYEVFLIGADTDKGSVIIYCTHRQMYYALNQGLAAMFTDEVCAEIHELLKSRYEEGKPVFRKSIL